MYDDVNFNGLYSLDLFEVNFFNNSVNQYEYVNSISLIGLINLQILLWFLFCFLLILYFTLLISYVNINNINKKKINNFNNLSIIILPILPTIILYNILNMNNNLNNSQNFFKFIDTYTFNQNNTSDSNLNTNNTSDSNLNTNNTSDSNLNTNNTSDSNLNTNNNSSSNSNTNNNSSSNSNTNNNSNSNSNTNNNSNSNSNTNNNSNSNSNINNNSNSNSNINNDSDSNSNKNNSNNTDTNKKIDNNVNINTKNNDSRVVLNSSKKDPILVNMKEHINNHIINNIYIDKKNKGYRIVNNSIVQLGRLSDDEREYILDNHPEKLDMYQYITAIFNEENLKKQHSTKDDNLAINDDYILPNNIKHTAGEKLISDYTEVMPSNNIKDVKLNLTQNKKTDLIEENKNIINLNIVEHNNSNSKNINNINNDTEISNVNIKILPNNNLNIENNDSKNKGTQNIDTDAVIKKICGFDYDAYQMALKRAGLKPDHDIIDFFIKSMEKTSQILLKEKNLNIAHKPNSFTTQYMNMCLNGSSNYSLTMSNYIFYKHFLLKNNPRLLRGFEPKLWQKCNLPKLSRSIIINSGKWNSTKQCGSEIDFLRLREFILVDAFKKTTKGTRDNINNYLNFPCLNCSLKIDSTLSLDSEVRYCLSANYNISNKSYLNPRSIYKQGLNVNNEYFMKNKKKK